MHVISMPAAGGAEVFVRDLAIQTAKAGHDVFVLFLESASEGRRDEHFSVGFLASLADAGVDYGYLGRRCRRNPVVGIRRLREHSRRWAPDVVHAHLYYGAVFAAFAPVRLIYTHHSIRLKTTKLLYRLFLDFRVSAYVGICEACAALLRNASTRPVVQINNGVSQNRLINRKPAPRRASPRVITVGRLVPEKNYGMLLRAVSEIGDVDFSLKIVGEGPERDGLERLSRDLGIDHKVELTGSSTEVSELLAESDLFVMTSIWEGLPIALIEATLSGLPVLVTNIGGCPEVVRNVGNGVVVDSLDPSVFAVELRRLLESHELRETFRQNARANCGPYSLEVAAEHHLALYSKVARNLDVA